jgi:methionine sulfoxide reductase heme-binding subunit
MMPLMPVMPPVASSALALADADPTLWYVTRAAAVSAYVLLALTTNLGIVRSLTTQIGERVSWVLDELHQFLALLTGAFVLLHLLTLLLDPFITFTPANLLLPFAQPYRTLATDLGVLGLYALVVVLVSSWLRRRISRGMWRGLHYLGFAAFFLVTIHGLLAGADAGQAWMRALSFGFGSAAVFLIVMRLILRPGEASDVTARASQRP